MAGTKLGQKPIDNNLLGTDLIPRTRSNAVLNTTWANIKDAIRSAFGLPANPTAGDVGKVLKVSAADQYSLGDPSLDYLRIQSTNEFLSNSAHRSRVLVPDINVNLKIGAGEEFTAGWWAIVDCPTSKLSLTSEHATTRLYPLGSVTDEGSALVSVTFLPGERILLFIDPTNTSKMNYKRIATREMMAGGRNIFIHEAGYSITDEMSTGHCLVNAPSGQQINISPQSTGQYRAEFRLRVTNFSPVASIKIKPSPTGIVRVNGIFDGEYDVRPFESVDIIKQIDDRFIIGGINSVLKTGDRMDASLFEKHTNTGDIATSYDFNFSVQAVESVRLTTNITATFSGAVSGYACSMAIKVTQDGTGGRTITWPAAVKWDGGTAPVLSTAANAVDLLTFLTVDGGATVYGALAIKGAA